MDAYIQSEEQFKPNTKPYLAALGMYGDVELEIGSFERDPWVDFRKSIFELSQAYDSKLDLYIAMTREFDEMDIYYEQHQAASALMTHPMYFFIGIGLLIILGSYVLYIPIQKFPIR